MVTARATTKATEQAKGKAPSAASAPRSAAKAGRAAAKVTVAPAGAGKTKAGQKVAAAAPPPATPAKAPVVTLKHLALGVAERRGTPKPETLAMALALIDDLLDQVRAGARVKIAGLGTIEVKSRPARTARNPATGEPVQVAASRKLAFRPAKDLKAAI